MKQACQAVKQTRLHHVIVLVHFCALAVVYAAYSCAHHQVAAANALLQKVRAVEQLAPIVDDMMQQVMSTGWRRSAGVLLPVLSF